MGSSLLAALVMGAGAASGWLSRTGAFRAARATAAMRISIASAPPMAPMTRLPTLLLLGR